MRMRSHAMHAPKDLPQEFYQRLLGRLCRRPDGLGLDLDHAPGLRTTSGRADRLQLLERHHGNALTVRFRGNKAKAETEREQ